MTGDKLMVPTVHLNGTSQAKLLDEQIASLVRQHGYGDVRLALIQHAVEMIGAQREAHLQRVLDETGQERAEYSSHYDADDKRKD